MSDDEDLMTDRRGIKRAHESPQKINGLFEGQALDVGDECSVESDDYPEDWNEHFHNKTAEAETQPEEEGDPEIIYPEHHEHHLEKAAFLFRELLADDKEIITKYKEQIAAFRIAKAWRGCVILNARTAPKYLKVFHSEIREIQKYGFHIQQVRPLLASSENFLMQFPQFQGKPKQTIQKATTRFVERFDRFVIDFKSTKYHIPDKGLRVLDEDGIIITDPCRPGFKKGEKVKEEFWGKSTDDKLRFLYDLSEYNVYQLMKNFFFEHNTIINTKTKTGKVLTFMYNNVYWEELTSSLAEIRGGKFNVMYLWLVKEWNDIQRMTRLDGCIMDVFKVSTDKQISQFKHKITDNIRKLHTIQFKNAVFKWFSDETFKQDIEFDTKKHLFAFEDCVYDLQKQCFIEPNPEDYVSLTAGYKYHDKNIKKEDVENAKQDITRFMTSILSNADEEAPVVLMIIASWLGDLYKWEKAWFFLGDGGNGKGALFQLIIPSFGNYAGNLQIEFWTTRDQTSDKPNSGLYKVRNARLIYTNEPDTSSSSGRAVPFVDGKFKQMTGGDSVTVRELNSTATEMIPGRCAWLLNTIKGLFPNVHHDQSLRRRIEIIKLPYFFTDDKDKIAADPSINKLIDAFENSNEDVHHKASREAPATIPAMSLPKTMAFGER